MTIRGLFFLIDSNTLKTGLGLWCELETNGTANYAYRAQLARQGFSDSWRLVDEDGEFDPDDIISEEPWDFYPSLISLFFSKICGKTGSCTESVDYSRCRVDMKEPIMNLLYINNKKKERLLEKWAPGYLEAKCQGGGPATSYNLEKLQMDSEFGKPEVKFFEVIIEQPETTQIVTVGL